MFQDYFQMAEFYIPKDLLFEHIVSWILRTFLWTDRDALLKLDHVSEYTYLYIFYILALVWQCDRQTYYVFTYLSALTLTNTSFCHFLNIFSIIVTLRSVMSEHFWEPFSKIQKMKWFQLVTQKMTWYISGLLVEESILQVIWNCPSLILYPHQPVIRLSGSIMVRKVFLFCNAKCRDVQCLLLMSKTR